MFFEDELAFYKTKRLYLGYSGLNIDLHDTFLFKDEKPNFTTINWKESIDFTITEKRVRIERKPVTTRCKDGYQNSIVNCRSTVLIPLILQTINSEWFPFSLLYLNIGMLSFFFFKF